jgi:hypothetical protein
MLTDYDAPAVATLMGLRASQPARKPPSTSPPASSASIPASPFDLYSIRFESSSRLA